MSDIHFRSATLAIRCATLADISSVLRFWGEAAEGTSISDDYDGVAGLISRDPEALLLAEREGVLAGTVIAGFDGWRCSAYRLAVHPDHRRQGVATALMPQRSSGSSPWAGAGSTPWSWRPTRRRTTHGRRPDTTARITGGAG